MEQSLLVGRRTLSSAPLSGLSGDYEKAICHNYSCGRQGNAHGDERQAQGLLRSAGGAGHHAFMPRYGANRQVAILRSPGRINLMGRRIDHPGGTVNVMAVTRAAFGQLLRISDRECSPKPKGVVSRWGALRRQHTVTIASLACRPRPLSRVSCSSIQSRRGPEGCA